MMFYYGHVAVVYVNKLRVAGYITEGVDEYLEQIMETGVDEMSWDDLSKNEMEWPPLRDVTEYRRKVYNLVRKIILEGDISFPIKMEDPSWSIVMGFEHERIHLETSSVLIRELPAYLVTVRRLSLSFSLSLSLSLSLSFASFTTSSFRSPPPSRPKPHPLSPQGKPTNKRTRRRQRKDEFRLK